MSLQESGEMYLETIYLLHKENKIVRAVDLAKAMDFSKPSVSRAVHNLKDNGYLEIEEDGNLKLTDEGVELARNIYEKHVFFSNFFIAIGVDEETAVEDACALEHVISDETFQKIKQYVSKSIELEGLDNYKKFIERNKKKSN